MSPARSKSGSLAAYPPVNGGEREISGPFQLDAALLQRAPADVAAMVPEVASPGGLPLWAKVASVPATVLLLAGLLIMSQQRSDAQLREARAEARQDRQEFRAAIDKLTVAVEGNTSAVKDLARHTERQERERDRHASRGKER